MACMFCQGIWIVYIESVPGDELVHDYSMTIIANSRSYIKLPITGELRTLVRARNSRSCAKPLVAGEIELSIMTKSPAHHSI